MKIQKLVYYAHGYFLAKTNGSPLVDELFEAWRFGPVLPSLYYEFRRYTADGITHYATNPDTGEIAPPPDDALATRLIDFVWERYGGLEATDLSRRTHKKGGPWERVISEHGGNIYRNVDIPNEYIQEYFARLV